MLASEFSPCPPSFLPLLLPSTYIYLRLYLLLSSSSVSRSAKTLLRLRKIIKSTHPELIDLANDETVFRCARCVCLQRRNPSHCSQDFSLLRRRWLHCLRFQGPTRFPSRLIRTWHSRQRRGRFDGSQRPLSPHCSPQGMPSSSSSYFRVHSESCFYIAM